MAANEDPTNPFSVQSVTLEQVESIQNDFEQLDELSHKMRSTIMNNNSNNMNIKYRREKYILHLIGAYKTKLKRPGDLQKYLTQKLGDVEEDADKTADEEAILQKLRDMQTAEGGRRRRRKSKSKSKKVKKSKKSKKTRKH